MVAKRQPYDTRALGESHKLLKFYISKKKYFHSFLSHVQSYHPIVQEMSKFGRGCKIIGIGQQEWCDSRPAMHWWVGTTEENPLTLMVGSKLLLLSTIAPAQKGVLNIFAIGRGQERFLSGGWQGQGVLLQEPSPQWIQLLCEQENNQNWPTNQWFHCICSLFKSV